MHSLTNDDLTHNLTQLLDGTRRGQPTDGWASQPADSANSHRRCGKLRNWNSPSEARMPSKLEVLQAEVLRLSPADRARLLDRLVASLDTDTSVEAAWDAVADLREQQLGSGAVEAVPLELAIARLEARFPG